MAEIFTGNEQLFLNGMEKLKGKLESSTYQSRGDDHSQFVEKQEASIAEGQSDIQDAENCVNLP